MSIDRHGEESTTWSESVHGQHRWPAWVYNRMHMLQVPMIEVRLPPCMQAAEDRARMLAPYLVPSPKHGIVGTSAYAERLRKQVLNAAKTPT